MSLTVYHSDRDLAPDARGAAVAFGSFDGLHLGHQEVIAEAMAAANRLGAPVGVVSLEPHPNTLFNPGGPPFHHANAQVTIKLANPSSVYTLEMYAPNDIPRP